MTGTLTINNWEFFQHYRERNPLWIKCYTELLQKYEWCALPDSAKGHLFGLWLLASKSTGILACDPEWIQRQISATEPIDFPLLIARGFLLPDKHASKLLAERYQDASNPLASRAPALSREKRQRREETEKRLPKRAREIDADFQPSEMSVQWAVENFPTVDWKAETPAFIDHHRGKGSLFKDHQAAWKTWIRNAFRFARPVSRASREPVSIPSLPSPPPVVELTPEQRRANYFDLLPEVNEWITKWGIPDNGHRHHFSTDFGFTWERWQKAAKEFGGEV